MAGVEPAASPPVPVGATHFICAACEEAPMSSLQARSNPEDANGDVGGLAHHPLVRQPPPRWTQCNPFHVSRPVPAVVRTNEVDAG